MGDWQRILFERRLLTWSSLLSVFVIIPFKVLPPLGILIDIPPLGILPFLSSLSTVDVFIVIFIILIVNWSSTVFIWIAFSSSYSLVMFVVTVMMIIFSLRVLAYGLQRSPPHTGWSLCPGHLINHQYHDDGGFEGLGEICIAS